MVRRWITISVTKRDRPEIVHCSSSKTLAKKVADTYKKRGQSAKAISISLPKRKRRKR